MVTSETYVVECMCEGALITLRYFPDTRNLLVTNAAGRRLRDMRWDGGWNGVLEAVDAMDERRSRTIAYSAGATAVSAREQLGSAVLA